MTIFEVMSLINTKDKAIKLFQRIRWQDGIYCIKCGLFDHVHRHGKVKNGFHKYKCIACKHVFSDTSGAIFHKRRGDIRHYLFALRELSQNKSIISVELGQKMGVGQKEAWSMSMLGIQSLHTHSLQR